MEADRIEDPAPAPLDRESVLVVEPDAKVCRHLGATLEAEGLHVEAVCTAPETERLLRTGSFDLLICDLDLLNQSPVDLVELMVRESPSGQVILTVAQLSRDTALEILERGVQDLLLKPYDLALLREKVSRALRQGRLEEENRWYLQLLEAKNQELQVLNERLSQMAVTDPLTQLFNHGHFIKELSKEVGRSRRYGNPLSLAIFDLDDFKRFNDTYGHLDGDRLLRRVTGVMSEKIRKQDVLCRYGGEEFALLQPETSLEASVQVARRVLYVVGQMPFKSSAHELRYVTLSAGLAQLGGELATPEDLLRAADTALYAAKAAGKNRLMVFRAGGCESPEQLGLDDGEV